MGCRVASQKSLKLTGKQGSRIAGYRTINLNTLNSDVYLYENWTSDLLHHSGGVGPRFGFARVYINGTFVVDESTRLTDAELRVAEVALRQDALQNLRPGENTIEIEVILGLDSKAGRIGKPADQVYFDFALMKLGQD